MRRSSRQTFWPTARSSGRWAGCRPAATRSGWKPRWNPAGTRGHERRAGRDGHVPLGGMGTSHSAVSRRFVAATAEWLTALLERPLDGQRWLVVFLDGFSMDE